MTTRQPSTRQRSAWPLILLLALGLLTATVALTSYRYFLSAELQRGEGRLSLYRSTVLAEVERFNHLAYILSVDPFVQQTVAGGDPATLDTRLADFAAAAGLDAIFLMGPDGVTISASNAGQPGSFVGENYSFRPYFRTSSAGERGTFYGIGATTGLPGYFIAEPVILGGSIAGVIALKLDLTPFEVSWSDAGEEVLLTDANGVVLLASDPAWRYRTLLPLDEAARARIAETRQFPGQDLAPLNWQAQDGTIRTGETDRLHLSTSDLPHGWQLHYLATADRALTQSTLAAGAVLVAAALALIVAQYVRGARLRAALKRAEDEEAALRIANEKLAQEIEDRRRAERRLSRTQEELSRASRLAALGKLAASVTHELGQPIAAMRNHLAAHDITGGTETPLSGKIAGLVDRMEGITRQLKFFARSGSEPFEEVEMTAAIGTALDLLAPNMDARPVTLTWQPPTQPIYVRGSRLRLEQMLTNIIRNALDAMEDLDTRTLDLTLGQSDGQVTVTVADRGHGLGNQTLADLQEPFQTTRASGQGMGLGLSISAGIVEDHGGHLTARNREGGGAVFAITLPEAAAQSVAAQ